MWKKKKEINNHFVIYKRTKLLEICKLFMNLQ